MPQQNSCSKGTDLQNTLAFGNAHMEGILLSHGANLFTNTPYYLY